MILDRAIKCKYSLQHYATIFIYKNVLANGINFHQMLPHLIYLFGSKKNITKNERTMYFHFLVLNLHVITYSYFSSPLPLKGNLALAIYFALDFEHI